MSSILRSACSRWRPLAGATLLLAGCATTDPRMTERGSIQSPSVKDAAIANAPDEVLPSIRPETHYAAGRMLEQQGAIDQAIVQYRKAVTLDSGYVDACHRLGLALSLAGQHEEASQAIAKASELRPNSAVLRNNLGFELLHLERWSDAERELRAAISFDPQMSRAHINLALLLGRTGRFDEALRSFGTVLPEADAYYNVGLLLRAQGKTEEASDAFRHVLTLNSSFTAATRQLDQIAEKRNPPPTSLRRIGDATIIAGTVHEPPMLQQPAPGALTMADFPTASTMTPSIHPASETDGAPHGDAPPRRDVVQPVELEPVGPQSPMMTQRANP